jgi:hypothetical protein
LVGGPLFFPLDGQTKGGVVVGTTTGSPYFVLPTTVENSSKVSKMIDPLFGVSSEIIKIRFHNPGDAMECIRHSPIESGSNIVKAKRHFPRGKGAPRADEGSFVLIFRFDLDLILPGESVHKGEDFISRTVIQDLINK